MTKQPPREGDMPAGTDLPSSTSLRRDLTAPQRFVPLRGGFVVPVEALALANSLEQRGATLFVNGADLIVDAPEELLIDSDAQIHRWKRHLIAIATYRAPALE